MAVANARAIRVKRADGTWQDIAIQGPPGPQGTAGATGAAGPTGPQGPAGGTMGSAVFKMLTMAGAVSATGWRALTVNTAGPTIDPAGSFTANTDSVTITEAGWYTISVAVLITVGGGVPLTINFSDTAASSGGSSGSAYIQSVGTSAAGDFRNLAHTAYLAAGSRLYVNAYTAASSSVRLDWLTIARVGGPKGDKGADGAPGGNATVPMDPWHLVGAAGEPAFNGAWVNFGGAEQVVGFRKDPLGKVQLRGIVKSGAVPGNIFILPAAYKPPMNVRFPVIANAAVAGYIQVAGSTGAVSLESGSNGWVDLAAVEFDTDTVTAMPTGPQGLKGDTGATGGTMGAAVYRNSNTGSAGPAQSVPATTWVAMDPRVAGQAVIEPAGAFVENADKTVTIVDAGWYSISGSVVTQINWDAVITTKIDIDGTTAVSNQGARGEVGRGAQAGISTAAVKLAAGAKVSIHAISGPSGAVSCALQNFAITRVGGPQGPQGIAGGMVKIADAILVGGNTLRFAAIPQTYTGLKLMVQGQSNRTGYPNTGLRIRFNGNSGSNYYTNYIRYGYTMAANSVTSGRAGPDSFGYLGQTPCGTRPDRCISQAAVEIPFYTVVGTEKHFLSKGNFDDGVSASGMDECNGFSTATDPITQIDIMDDVVGALGPMARATLYGIP